MRDLGLSPPSLCAQITRTVVRLLRGYATALVVLASSKPDGRIRGVQVGSCAYEDLARAIEDVIGSPR